MTPGRDLSLGTAADWQEVGVLLANHIKRSAAVCREEQERSRRAEEHPAALFVALLALSLS